MFFRGNAVFGIDNDLRASTSRIRRGKPRLILVGKFRNAANMDGHCHDDNSGRQNAYPCD